MQYPVSLDSLSLSLQQPPWAIAASSVIMPRPSITYGLLPVVKDKQEVAKVIKKTITCRTGLMSLSPSSAVPRAIAASKVIMLRPSITHSVIAFPGGQGQTVCSGNG